MFCRSVFGVLACIICAVLPVQAQGGSTASRDEGETRVIIAGFIPKVWPAGLFAALYFVSGTLHWIHYFRTGRPRYMLTLTISMYTMALGFIFRIVYALGDNIYSIAWFVLQSTFILLSPCAFIALDYVLLSKLSESLGEDVTKDCLFIRSSIIVKVFVWSDVVTFDVQANGAGLTATPRIAHIGSIIAMVGLILQIISFVLFTALLFRFGLRARSHHPGIWRIGAGGSGWRELGPYKVTPFHDWRVLWGLVCFTTITIVIRCIFRIVEYGQGDRGYLVLHEGYSHLLDSLPLWISMTLYALLWPHRLVPVAGTASSGSSYAMQPINGH